MKLYSWNVNGLRAVLRKGALQGMLEQYQPDVLCLQEIKARPDQVDFQPQGYSVHWNPAQRAGYSGTALVVRSERPPLSVHTQLPDSLLEDYAWGQDSFGDAHSEGRLQCAEYPGFYLVNVYVPNVKRDLSRLEVRHQGWDPLLLRYLLQLERRKPVILCGDLNVAHQEIDLARPESNQGAAGFTPQERAGFQALLDHGWLDSFRLQEPGGGHYTWWSHQGGARERNIGWRIDYFLLSSRLQSALQQAKIHPEITGSDHCPVSVQLHAEDL